MEDTKVLERRCPVVKRNLGRWPLVAILVGIAFMVAATDVCAQSGGNPMAFLDKTRETAKAGWSYLTTAAAFVVGGGALAAGGRALFRGEWQHGAIGIGFGIAILLLMYGLGGFFFGNGGF